MPTVLRTGGLRVVIYPNDHRPAHVHVVGPGWVVVVELVGPTVRTVVGANTAEAAHVLRVVAAHRAVLMEAWRRWHG